MPRRHDGLVELSLQLSEDDELALAVLIETLGLTKEEAAERAIHESASNQARREVVDEAIEWGLTRYAGVLERLSKT
ncbi:MAG: hypothetical protein ACRCY9_02025 [Phycicoccus sp.]